MIARPVTAALLCLALLAPAVPAFAETAPAKPFFLAGLFKHRPKAETPDAAVIAGGKGDASARSALKVQVKAVTAATPRRGRIWCVPFARAVTGIDLRGNAATWWKQAAARYERGNEPRIGAVMNFRASKAMPMGHVAVVSRVVSAREVLVDQANWERNRITQDTRVIDVSAANDWSQVRVAGSNGTLGRTNPVYGFIYN